MKHITAILLTATVLLASSASASETDVATLKNKLKPWQPSEVSVNGKQITIAIPSKDITQDVYKAIISNGVCTPIWTKDVPASYLKNIQQINVTNKFKGLGYSFENPLSVCKEMGDLMDKPAELKMLSNTHLYKAKQ